VLTAIILQRENKITGMNKSVTAAQYSGMHEIITVALLNVKSRFSALLASVLRTLFAKAT
jgi:hypothetical protein